MSNHKTTPEQWDELRVRVEALEAQAGNLKGSLTSSTPPPVATDEELSETWYKAPGERMNRFRAFYDLGIEHGQARSQEVAEPAPVAREVAELVTDLRRMADWAVATCEFNDGETLTRAANMIQQLSEQEAGR
jgi:hypothetical protein